MHTGWNTLKCLLQSHQACMAPVTTKILSLKMVGAVPDCQMVGPPAVTFCWLGAAGAKRAAAPTKD